MSGDPETLKVYAAQAEDYVNLATAEDPAATLDPFLDALPRGAAILDLGCGPGHLAAVMRDRGFAVTGTDACPQMTRIAHETYGLQIRVADFADLDDVAAFDGVLASFSLLHAPKAQMPSLLAAVHRALRPGGQLSLGLKLGEGEARDRLGRFYAYYSDPEISALLARAGFSVTGRTTGSGTGLDGTVAPWIVLRAHA